MLHLDWSVFHGKCNWIQYVAAGGKSVSTAQANQTIIQNDNLLLSVPRWREGNLVLLTGCVCLFCLQSWTRIQSAKRSDKRLLSAHRKQSDRSYHWNTFCHCWPLAHSHTCSHWNRHKVQRTYMYKNKYMNWKQYLGLKRQHDCQLNLLTVNRQYWLNKNIYAILT